MSATLRLLHPLLCLLLLLTGLSGAHAHIPAKLPSAPHAHVLDHHHAAPHAHHALSAHHHDEAVQDLELPGVQSPLAKSLLDLAALPAAGFSFHAATQTGPGPRLRNSHPPPRASGLRQPPLRGPPAHAPA